MKIDVDELKGRFYIGNEEYYAIMYFLNGVMVNVRFFEKENNLKEIFPQNVGHEIGKALITTVHDFGNLTLLNEQEEDLFDEYLVKIDLKIEETINNMDKEQFNVCGRGMLAGKHFIVSKPEKQKYLDMFLIYSTDNGEQVEATITDNKTNEYMCMKILQERKKIKMEYIKVNPLTFFGIVKMGIKNENYYSVAVLELGEKGINCKKAYAIKREDNQLETLDIEDYTKKEVGECLKEDVQLLTNRLLKVL